MSSGIIVAIAVIILIVLTIVFYTFYLIGQKQSNQTSTVHFPPPTGYGTSLSSGTLTGRIFESGLCGTTTVGNGTGCSYKSITLFAIGSNSTYSFNSIMNKTIGAMYSVKLSVGNYMVSTNCASPCSSSLPANVVIKVNQTTILNITINFGTI